MLDSRSFAHCLAPPLKPQSGFVTTTRDGVKRLAATERGSRSPTTINAVNSRKVMEASRGTHWHRCAQKRKSDLHSRRRRSGGGRASGSDGGRSLGRRLGRQGKESGVD